MSKTDDIEHALRMLNEAFARARSARRSTSARTRGCGPGKRTSGRGAKGRGGEREKRSVAAFRTPGCQVPAEAETPPAAFPGPAQGHLAFPRRPIRLDLPVRLLRRRGLAYGGMLPPAIAKTFTVGQAAVLTRCRMGTPAPRRLPEELRRDRRRGRLLAELGQGDDRGCAPGRAHRASSIAPGPGARTTPTSSASSPADWLAWIKTRAERIESGRARGRHRGKQGSHLT